MPRLAAPWTDRPFRLTLAAPRAQVARELDGDGGAGEAQRVSEALLQTVRQVVKATTKKALSSGA